MREIERENEKRTEKLLSFTQEIILENLFTRIYSIQFE